MTRRIHTAGRDSWQARSGYQRSPRVPGPIVPAEAPAAFHWAMRALFLALTVAAVGGSVWWAA